MKTQVRARVARHAAQAACLGVLLSCLPMAQASAWRSRPALRARSSCSTPIPDAAEASAPIAPAIPSPTVASRQSRRLHPAASSAARLCPGARLLARSPGGITDRPTRCAPTPRLPGICRSGWPSTKTCLRWSAGAPPSPGARFQPPQSWSSSSVRIQQLAPAQPDARGSARPPPGPRGKLRASLACRADAGSASLRATLATLPADRQAMVRRAFQDLQAECLIEQRETSAQLGAVRSHVLSAGARHPLQPAAH
jgi:hypothetical protein